MSKQHLFKFQTENDYKIAKRNHLIIPNISKVVETGNTYINSNFVSKEAAEAGDFIVYHEEENGQKTVKFMKPEAFDANDGYWTVDAIVVVPFKHTNDGTVRAMALNYASVTNPSEGGNGEQIKWGGEVSQDYKKYGDFIVFSSINEQTSEDTVGVLSSGFMSSDSLESAANSVINPFDTEAYYGSNYSNSVVPSPYNNDGSVNEAYHSIGAFAQFTQNPLQDMDGQGNTLNLLSLLDSQYLEETLYAQTLINENTTEIAGETVQLFPSASACARYGTNLKPCTFDATKTFEENKETMPWYFPSAGEVGYFLSRLGRINYALGEVGKTPITEEVVCATSTVVEPTQADGSTHMAVITTNVCNVANGSASNNNLFVIPFCKL